MKEDEDYHDRIPKKRFRNAKTRKGFKKKKKSESFQAKAQSPSWILS